MWTVTMVTQRRLKLRWENVSNRTASQQSPSLPSDIPERGVGVSSDSQQSSDYQFSLCKFSGRSLGDQDSGEKKKKLWSEIFLPSFAPIGS
ncbi:hypothetical protein CDAR_461411 [Caerostris darwini]|uniref:Uncharacterized protein n=1 Tax=Caerostris darwini TaxID=1538125 RepID=A0AAV4NDR3_9ARAC|nr:hypothetical protein CDAR_461411 [Caerostris darwini]